jgi:Protein of unknown function (DUF1559)
MLATPNRQTSTGNFLVRAGLSLVELLVVIGIIGILVGLLLPAVQRVRESASRLRCANHLKQVSLGWHLHADAHGVYPTNGSAGGVFDDGPNSPPVRFAALGQPLVGAAGKNGQWASWLYQLLPFVEQENAWRQASAGSYRQARLNITSTPVWLYICPSRPRSATFLPSGGTGPSSAIALNDYAANWGRADRNEGVLSYSLPAPGVEYQPDLLAEKDITDGLSNTLFVGETSMPVAYYTPEKLPNLEFAGYVRGRTNEVTRNTGWSRGEAVIPVPDRDPLAGHNNRFGSAHPSGIMAGFGDGSVRLISYSISGQTWLALGGRNDGLIPGLDW